MMTSFSHDDAIARFTGLTLDPSPTTATSLTQAVPVSPEKIAMLANGNGNNTGASDTEHSEIITNSSPSEPLESAAISPVPEAHDETQDNTDAPLVLRSLVSTKEAGIIIGKGGKNVAEVRDVTGVRAGVSKVLPGVHERVLMVSGDLESVAKAYGMISRHLLVVPPPPPPPSALQPVPPTTSTSTTLRLLIPHQIMGSLIGKSGSTIREVQESSGCRIVVSKEMLPNSTERLMELSGSSDSIQIAVHRIAEILIRDAEKSRGCIHYTASVPHRRQPYSRDNSNYPSRDNFGSRDYHHHTNGNMSYSHNSRYQQDNRERRPRDNYNYNQNNRGYRYESDAPPTPSTDPNMEMQTLSIPADLIGCLIGHQGSVIAKIRAESGSRISIAKRPNKDGDRWIAIEGTHEQTQKALFMVYEDLEKEKKRRAELAATAADNETGTTPLETNPAVAPAGSNE